MSEEPGLSEDALEVFETLEQVERRIRELREEREKLLTANKLLLDLVDQLEGRLGEHEEPEEMEDVEVADYVYSFTEGWQKKRRVSAEKGVSSLGDDVDPGNPGSEIDMDAIEKQINRVQKLMRSVSGAER